MAHPSVSTLAPNFHVPDHFTRTSTGRYACTLCPLTSDGALLSFRSDKAALEHEKSFKHSESVEAAKKDPWFVNHPDWSSQPGKDTSWMTPDQIKDLEYRRRTAEIPSRVAAWIKGFAQFVEKGEMLPVNAPPKKLSSRQRKKLSASISASSTVAEPEESDVDQIDHMAIRSRAMAKAKALRDQERAARALASTAPPPPSSSPTVSGSGTLAAARVEHSYVPTPIPKTNNPLEITPAMRDWMAKIASEHRFSPRKARQMREFIQLPTDAKVSMIETSAVEVRALLFT